ncbi:MAG: hypothetical protein GIW95_09940 [Candidatus Eremiobacteraeota bacterium]|nr:hypothetical protein [Candidatus Eremiobacteraeota bacterium]
MRLSGSWFALALLVVPAAVVAQPAGWSVTAPTRHEIDAACDGYAKAPGLTTYRMTRYSTEGTSKGPWYASDDKRNEKLMGNQKAVEYDLVTVRTRGPHVVTAEMATASVTGDGSNTNGYCFIGGKLVRGTADVLDVSQDMSWSRVRYFDGATVVAEKLTPKSLAPKRSGPLPAPPAEALAIPRYATPEKLPFFAAFQKARAGTLPPLKFPA